MAGKITRRSILRLGATPLVTFPAPGPANQPADSAAANRFYAGPASGGPAAPSFRKITSPDLPLGWVIVDGITYPRTNAGIQAAIDACPIGGTVYLPEGAYDIAGTITIAKPITIQGAGAGTGFVGLGGTVLGVSRSLSAAADIFLVQPAAASKGHGDWIRFADFAIVANSGKPGRHGINLSGAKNVIVNFTMERVQINQLNGNAVNASGSGSAQGTPVLATINNCVLWGGVVMTNAGDTVRITNSQITGTGRLSFAFQPGASTLIVQGNNITISEGIHLGPNTVSAHIIGNEIEADGITGSNGAMIDVDVATGAVIAFNSIQIVGGSTLHGIRVNDAVGTHIFGNTFERGGSPAVDIQITSKAVSTLVGSNVWASGAPLTSMVADSGLATSCVFGFNDGGLAIKETAAPAGSLPGASILYADSTAHQLKSALNGGAFLTIPQILTASLTTTNAASDVVSVPNLPGTGHCILVPRNAAAAANVTGTFVSGISAGSVTVAHAGIAGMLYDLICFAQ